MKKTAINLFFLIILSSSIADIDYSKLLVNDFNSKFLRDRRNNYLDPIVEEKFLLDSIMNNLPPSRDTTYLFFERNLERNFALLGFNSKKNVYFKYINMTKDSFIFKKYFTENWLKKYRYFKIEKIKTERNISYILNVLQNKDTFETITNPGYSYFFTTNILSYWMDSANNFNYSVYGYKFTNGTLRFMKVKSNDSIVISNTTNKLARIRFH